MSLHSSDHGIGVELSWEGGRGGLGSTAGPHSEAPDIDTNRHQARARSIVHCRLTSGSVCNRLIVDSAHGHGLMVPCYQISPRIRGAGIRLDSSPTTEG